MENASKALIIAGAILLSILIIAIGMYIYNSSTNSIYSAADQISSQEQQSFNSQWESYEQNQPGSSVKNMISKLISNAQVNAEEKTKLPDLLYEATESSDTAEQVESKVGSTNVKGMNTARSNIETKHNYYVELHYASDTGLVDAIYIHYEKPDTLPTLDKDTYVNSIEGEDLGA
jgi:hypothetical protein